MTRTRLSATERKTDMLAAALKLAADKGYLHITRDDIADKTGVTGPTVHYHFHSMDALRRALMLYAIEQRNASVVAQGLAVGDEVARGADSALKAQAARALID